MGRAPRGSTLAFQEGHLNSGLRAIDLLTNGFFLQLHFHLLDLFPSSSSRAYSPEPEWIKFNSPLIIISEQVCSVEPDLAAKRSGSSATPRSLQVEIKSSKLVNNSAAGGNMWELNQALALSATFDETKRKNWVESEFIDTQIIGYMLALRVRLFDGSNFVHKSNFPIPQFESASSDKDLSINPR